VKQFGSLSFFLFFPALCLLSEPSFVQPTIISHAPGQNAVDVVANTDIQVQFSENIDGSMTGLKPNTLYYVWAYATNDAGTT